MIEVKVMLLGASGFIGRQCIDLLLQADNVIVEAVSRCKPSWAGPDDDRVRWHTADLLDCAGLAGILDQTRPSHAIHLAWHSGPDLIWTSPQNMDWIAASLAFARSFAHFGGKRIVVSGSCAEYTGSGVWREADVTQPETQYGLAKRETHLALTSYFEAAGISFAWARLFYMYGPHENPRRLIAGAIVALLQGRLFVCSDGGQVRDFLYSRDVAQGLAALLWSQVEGPINIGSGEAVSIREILGLIGHKINRSYLLQFGGRARAVNDPDVILPDLTRQKHDLGWSPAFSHEQRIASTIDWWRERLGTSRSYSPD